MLLTHGLNYSAIGRKNFNSMQKKNQINDSAQSQNKHFGRKTQPPKVVANPDRHQLKNNNNLKNNKNGNYNNFIGDKGKSKI